MSGTQALPEGDGPLRYEDLIGATRELKRRYDFFQSLTVGKSVLGRGIPAYALGVGQADVLYAGGFHGTDSASPALLVQFADRICRHLQENSRMDGLDITGYLADHVVYILPMLNPDGAEICLGGMETAGGFAQAVRRCARGRAELWQANVRGVDLSHNFHYGFENYRMAARAAGVTAPAPSGYPGPRAESEPESRTLANLCRRLMFRKAIAFCGTDGRVRWAGGARTPRSSREMARMLSAATGCEAMPDQDPADGGFGGWFVSVFGRPAFAVGPQGAESAAALPLGLFL